MVFSTHGAVVAYVSDVFYLTLLPALSVISCLNYCEAVLFQLLFLVLVSVKVLDHKFFSVTIKFQLCYFSFSFIYCCDLSVSVPVFVKHSQSLNFLFTFRSVLLASFLQRRFLFLEVR